MKKTVLSLMALCFLAGSAGAQLLFTYSDTTVGDPTWNRPLAGTPPTALSGVGTAVHYDVLAFVVSTTGSYIFQETATNPANWDNFTFLYQNAFNAATPLANALIGNDDNQTIGLSGFTRTLTAGTQYYFISTGFSNTDQGAFRLVINGPGNVSGQGVVAVPETSTVVAGVLAVVGTLGVVIRRRARGAVARA